MSFYKAGAVATVATAFVLAAPVGADAAAPADGGGVSAAALSCRATVLPGNSAVKVRASKSTTATAIDQINPGEWASAACAASEGGAYKDCRADRTDRTWVQVSIRGRTGWSAERCLFWTN